MKCKYWCSVVFILLFAAGIVACGESKPSDDKPFCGDNQKEGDEVCDGTDLGGETCESLSFLGGDLACEEGCGAFDTSGCTGCTDECTTVGETQCNGTVIETCTVRPDGCNDWVGGVDCATTADPFCDDTAEPAVCVSNCVNECANVDETQCNGTVIETCTVQADGCNDWIGGVDCADNGESCDDSAEPAVCVASYRYDLAFSTYLGGSDWEHARDVFVDGQGYVYVVGGTTSDDFPTTTGAYQRAQDKTGSQVGSGGYCDAFVAKFGPGGVLVWSTYLGGPNYDRAYGVEVDDQGYVYVAGRAGPGFPVTVGVVFQDTFQGRDAGIYGQQNAFVAKLEPDGSDLVWASYAGVATLSRDIAIDTNGDIYLPVGYPGQGALPPAQWYANAFQSSPQGGQDAGAMKIAGDGTQVIWATFLGGSGDDSTAASIRVDAGGHVYVSPYVNSADLPTPNGADPTFNGGFDRYVAKLTPDGSDLVFGTYVGGSGDEGVDTHNLAVDGQGNVYLSMYTTSADFPVTPDAFQQTLGGGNNDLGVVKLSPDGALLAGTLIGGNGEEAPDGIYADASGNVFISGVSNSTDFPVTTATAYQAQIGGSADAVLINLSADFKQMLYATYIGGPAYDYGRSGFLDAAGNLYVTGSTDGTGWPTLNAYQDTYAGGVGSCYEGGCYAGDVILAKFTAR